MCVLLIIHNDITYEYTCILYIHYTGLNSLPSCRTSEAPSCRVRLDAAHDQAFGIPISTFLHYVCQLLQLSFLAITVLRWIFTNRQNPKTRQVQDLPKITQLSVFLALHLCHMLLHSLECRLLPSDHCEPWLQLTQITTAGSPDRFPFCIFWKGKKHTTSDLPYGNQTWLTGKSIICG